MCTRGRNKNRPCPPPKFALAPPLPPIAPPTPLTYFPYTTCKNRAAASAPYTVKYSGMEKLQGSNRVCFGISRKAACTPPPDNSTARNCCEMDVAKFNLAVNAACSDARAVKRVLFNGREVEWSYARHDTPAGELVALKVTAMRVVHDSFGPWPASLCLDLSAPCGSLKALCTGGVCRHTLFDRESSTGVEDGGCCPTGQLFSATSTA